MRYKLLHLFLILGLTLMVSCNSEIEPDFDNNDDIEEPEPEPETPIDPELFAIGVDNLKFTETGEEIQFDICVIPSDLIFNYDLTSPECQIQMFFSKDYELENFNPEAATEKKEVWAYEGEKENEGIEEVRIYPFSMSNITISSTNSENHYKRYTITLKDSGDNFLKYEEEVYITLTFNNEQNEEIILSTNKFIVGFESPTPYTLNTGLPIMVIETPYLITSKESWTEGCKIKIYDIDGSVEDYEKVQMKGRGNTTWGNPKKPYAIKLDSKKEVLGMKKHKRWCLLANYLDRTLLRNAVAFEISKMTDLDYSPSGRFVELIMNGEHKGNYYLTEQIKVDKNRVDITELDPDATEGDAITGGYIFELDIYFDEAYKFTSSIFNLPWMFKDPDEVNSAQFDYVVEYVNQMETAISNIPLSDEYLDFIDIDSCIDWWFVHELMNNTEPTAPKSTYFHKDKNGIMKMGPVWDFDWGTLIKTSFTNFGLKNSVYFSKLFEDETFKARVKERWEILYPKFATIPLFIDEQSSQLVKSDQKNYAIWGYNDYPNYESHNYIEAINQIKASYEAKLEWLNSQIPNL